MTARSVTQCEGVDGLGSFGSPPEQCEEDALDGICFCMRHLVEYDTRWCSDHEPEEAEVSLSV